MQGIFLFLLIGYAAAQQYVQETLQLTQYPVQQQQQTLFPVNVNVAAQQQQQQQQQPQQQTSQQWSYKPNTRFPSQQQQQESRSKYATQNQQQSQSTPSIQQFPVQQQQTTGHFPLNVNNVPPSQIQSRQPQFHTANPNVLRTVVDTHAVQKEQPELIFYSETAERSKTPAQDVTTAQVPNHKPKAHRPTVTNRNPSSGSSSASTTVPLNSHNRFSATLFDIIGTAHARHNIVYSPISLQLLLAWVYTGASGKTAQELERALSLPASRNEVAQMFRQLLASQVNAGDTKLIMANKMYYNENLQLQQSALHTARNYFDSDIEPINFVAATTAAARINQWVAQKTENHIENLVSPQLFDAYTQAILLNAIYFKAKWAKEFSTIDTEQQDFYITAERTVPVQMMYNDDVYRYGEFEDLDASALELGYQDSDLTMLILLPNKVDGLTQLEQSLRNTDFNELTARMQPETVTVRVPKFKIDFELDMVEPLKALDIRELFTDNAQLNDFFRSQPVGVSKVQHKAYLDVNEAGSEAAAASFIKLIPLSLPSRIIRFTANHPFMFAIRSRQAVYFVGHVVNF